jgi:hypothetical protein
MTSVFSGREANWTSDRRIENDRSALAIPMTLAIILTLPADSRKGQKVSRLRSRG